MFRIRKTSLSPHFFSLALHVSKLDPFEETETPSLCNQTRQTHSSLNSLNTPHTTNQHIQHTPHLPCVLARLNSDLDALHKCQDEVIDLLASAELIGVQVQDDEGDVGGEAGDAVVGDVLDAPSEDRLEGEGVAVAEGGAESGAVAESG